MSAKFGLKLKTIALKILSLKCKHPIFTVAENIVPALWYVGVYM